jgi:hypothetical protein
MLEEYQQVCEILSGLYETFVAVAQNKPDVAGIC